MVHFLNKAILTANFQLQNCILCLIYVNSSTSNKAFENLAIIRKLNSHVLEFLLVIFSNKLNINISCTSLFIFLISQTPDTIKKTSEWRQPTWLNHGYWLWSVGLRRLISVCLKTKSQSIGPWMSRTWEKFSLISSHFRLFWANNREEHSKETVSTFWHFVIRLFVC